jgi:hypothetical protein
MANNQMFRLAGWCALAAAIIMAVAIVSFPLGIIMVGVIGEYLGLLLSIVVFYALYVAYRSQSAGLSLAGLVLLVLALVLDAAGNINHGNNLGNTLGDLWYLAFSLPFLIFGSLILRSTKMPRALAIGTLLMGALLLIGGVGGLLGNQAFADNVTSIPFLLVIVWLVWLWRVFWSGRMVPAIT